MIVKSGQRGPDVCELAGLERSQWPDVFDAMVEIMAAPQAPPDPFSAPVDWDKKFADLGKRR